MPRKGGLTPAWHAEAIRLHADGLTIYGIAKRYGVNVSVAHFAVHESLTALGLPPRVRRTKEEQRRRINERERAERAARPASERGQPNEARARYMREWRRKRKLDAA